MHQEEEVPEEEEDEETRKKRKGWKKQFMEDIFNQEYLFMFNKRFNKGQAQDGQGGKARTAGGQQDFNADDIEVEVKLPLEALLFCKEQTIKHTVEFDRENICPSCNGTRE